MSRYIIFGAGSVGGLIGGRLQSAGKEVAFIARGRHRDALSQRGLRIRTAEDEQIMRVAVFGAASELAFYPDDTVILAMKTQDSATAIEALASVAPTQTTIVCAQNGLESERLALRHFSSVYGAYVFVYAALAEPGTVDCHTSPSFGIIDVGRYPNGCDRGAMVIAEDLREAGFDSIAREDIMRWKRGKLILNVLNGFAAACWERERLKDLSARTQQEAEQCFSAAGLAFASREETRARAQDLTSLRDVAGHPFPGGSTLQSLTRSSGVTEVDFLNGEISLLGRLYGMPTPLNAFQQALIRDLIRSGAPPQSLSAAEVYRKLAKY